MLKFNLGNVSAVICNQTVKVQFSTLQVISVKPFEDTVAENFYHNGPSFHPDGDNIVFCGVSAHEETENGIRKNRFSRYF